MYIVLFVYAATSKILDYENFTVQIGQSPLLSVFAGLISWLIPTIEIILALLLMSKKTQFLALNASFVLMMMFTAYIFIILNFSAYVPCSCGGVLEKMSWTEHMYFNIAFCLLALIAIIFSLQQLPLQSNTSKRKSKLLLLVMAAALGIAIVYGSFLKSEHIIHQENNFVRRYPPHLYKRMAKLELKYGGYYFAGYSNDTIYMGNYRAPLAILAISSDLKNAVEHKIELNNYDLPFRAANVRVLNQNFFLSDGTVPCLFRGDISSWNATQLSIPKKKFSAFEPIDSATAVIRSRKPMINESIVGLINLSKQNSEIFWNNKVLEKQIDGVFDCDGILNYNIELGYIIYTYYYRNQFIVSDNTLKIQYRNNTIDTTTKAKIKIVKLKNGDRKMAIPPVTVNRLMTTSGKYLFVNSDIRGHYESLKLWKQSLPVDVYNLVTKEYMYSFQVHNIKGKKPNAMFAAKNTVYFVFDKTMVGYKLDKSVIKNNIRNEIEHL
ncbi:DoxX family protein [Flavobacterium sp. YZ-48]|uniref:DoxX family protein n=2 Tax=Flavobacterium sedimenticola TaxID=3043286 RepID=A0ABT6XT30_9FLAO|nr:DoxX family protein [Flavobacterium sedimenticola]MDI9257957.1 DoxX family protein [Flavobacterium sedimenticola]